MYRPYGHKWNNIFNNWQTDKKFNSPNCPIIRLFIIKLLTLVENYDSTSNILFHLGPTLKMITIKKKTIKILKYNELEIWWVTTF